MSRGNLKRHKSFFIWQRCLKCCLLIWYDHQRYFYSSIENQKGCFLTEMASTYCVHSSFDTHRSVKRRNFFNSWQRLELNIKFVRSWQIWWILSNNCQLNWLSRKLMRNERFFANQFCSRNFEISVSDSTFMLEFTPNLIKIMLKIVKIRF